MSRDVAVIGAGPAGLAAAWELVSSGCTVTLYEREAGVGGRLRTDALEGVRADVVVQLLGAYYDETLRLAREVGAGDLLRRSPGRDALWRGGRAHPITYGSVASMATSSALPAGLKFRLAGRYLPFLRRHSRSLDPNRPVLALEAGLDDESIASWGRREVGDDFVELLVYPQLAAYYGATPEETSAGFYHALASAGLDLGLVAVRGGVASLVDALLRAIEGRGGRLESGVDVRVVRSADDGVRVEWDGGARRHDAAVVAVPAAVAREVLEVDDDVREWLSGVRTAPAASLALLVEGPPLADFFGLSFPRVDPAGARVAALCIEANKGAGLEAEGRSVVVLYAAPAAAESLATMAPRDVLDAMLPAAETAFPGLRGRIRRAKSYRIPAGGTLFPPGYLAHLRRFPAHRLPATLALAGDYLVAPTVEGAVRSGRVAARQVLR